MDRIDTDTIIILCPPCPYCRKISRLEVKRVEWEVFNKGAHVQDAFPDMSTDERELLLTGYCIPCWDEVMGSDEDDDA